MKKTQIGHTQVRKDLHILTLSKFGCSSFMYLNVGCWLYWNADCL